MSALETAAISIRNDFDQTKITVTPVIDILLIDMLFNLIKQLLIECKWIKPTNAYEWLTRSPEWYEVFFEGRRARTIRWAIKDKWGQDKVNQSGITQDEMYDAVIYKLKHSPYGLFEDSFNEVQAKLATGPL